MTGVILFIFGTIFGSFLNVVSLRYDPEKSIFSPQNVSGRSHCLHCGKTLSWYELIPLFSFLLQLGRCRSCGTRLSWQYPLVEFASGLAFLVPLYLISNFQFAIPNYYLLITSIVWILVFLIFILIWTIDFRWYLIPNELNASLALLGILITAMNWAQGNFGEVEGSFIGSYAALFGLRQNIWLNHLAASLIGMGVVGLIVAATRGKGMGLGDLKLLGALGVIFGWPDILFIFVAASFIGAAVSVVLMALGKRNMKSVVPFGPFLVAGSFLIFFFGEQMLGGYFRLFSLEGLLS
jgi:prepilin signal peptidase PulO-like enzyme (type II secretory pathway)